MLSIWAERLIYAFLFAARYQMYGHYREDLGEYAKRQAKKINKLRNEEKILTQKGLKKSVWKRKITGLSPISDRTASDSDSRQT